MIADFIAGFKEGMLNPGSFEDMPERWLVLIIILLVIIILVLIDEIK